jgi:hypothetical protein
MAADRTADFERLLYQLSNHPNRDLRHLFGRNNVEAKKMKIEDISRAHLKQMMIEFCRHDQYLILEQVMIPLAADDRDLFTEVSNLLASKPLRKEKFDACMKRLLETSHSDKEVKSLIP